MTNNYYAIFRNTPGYAGTSLVGQNYVGYSAADAWEKFLLDDKSRDGFKSLHRTYKSEYENSVFIIARQKQGDDGLWISGKDIHIARVEKKAISEIRWVSRSIT